MQNHDDRIVGNILEFLARADLKGNEAYAYCEAVEYLRQTLEAHRAVRLDKDSVDSGYEL